MKRRNFKGKGKDKLRFVARGERGERSKGKDSGFRDEVCDGKGEGKGEGTEGRVMGK